MIKRNPRAQDFGREVGNEFTFFAFVDFLVRMSKSIYVSEYPFRRVQNFE